MVTEHEAVLMPPTVRATMDVEEWALQLGFGRNKAYDLARRGEIPGLIKFGNRYVISRAVTERLLAGEQV